MHNSVPQLWTHCPSTQLPRPKALALECCTQRLYGSPFMCFQFLMTESLICKVGVTDGNNTAFVLFNIFGLRKWKIPHINVPLALLILGTLTGGYGGQCVPVIRWSVVWIPGPVDWAHNWALEQGPHPPNSRGAAFMTLCCGKQAWPHLHVCLCVS